VMQRAERLRDEAEAAAAVLRRVLDDACESAPHPPSWFHQMLHGLAADLHQAAGALHDFVVRYAPQIEALSEWCSKAASALAEVGFVLSIVPGVGEAAGGVLVSASIGLTVIAIAGQATLAAAGEVGAERAATLPLPWRTMPVMTEREFVLRAVRLHVDGAAAALGTVDLAKIGEEWPALLGRRPAPVAAG
jgi:hypothetical protein